MISIKYIFLILFCSVLFQASGSDIEKWNYETGGKVTAQAILENGVLYMGSSDKYFYALNASTGELHWKYETPGEVKTRALLVGAAVVVHTQSVLLGLSKADGSFMWKYTPTQAKGGLPVSAKDEWDYHASSPIVWHDSICYGDDFGQIHVVHPNTGEGRVLMALESKASIRTELCVSDGVIYFGDWDGYVYAYHVASDSFKWSFKSFDKKRYASYGPIITKPVVNKGKLYVGARNYDFTVLNIEDGTIAWQFNEPDGGWLTGTPLIVNDTLFMGGSDNKEMIAFNAITGEKFWTFKSRQNIFCEPSYINGKLVFVDGDSYNHESGSGFLYVIDSKMGLKLKEIEVGRNVYSSPAVVGDKVYFGCYDHKIYSIKIFD